MHMYRWNTSLWNTLLHYFVYFLGLESISIFPQALCIFLHALFLHVFLRNVSVVQKNRIRCTPKTQNDSKDLQNEAKYPPKRKKMLTKRCKGPPKRVKRPPKRSTNCLSPSNHTCLPGRARKVGGKDPQDVWCESPYRAVWKSSWCRQEGRQLKTGGNNRSLRFSRAVSIRQCYLSEWKSEEAGGLHTMELMANRTDMNCYHGYTTTPFFLINRWDTSCKATSAKTE